MNIFQEITAWLFKPQVRKPTPAEFRRGKTTRRILGILPDLNSRHVGSFKGGIVPMKRRRKGVSRTHGGKA